MQQMHLVFARTVQLLIVYLSGAIAFQIIGCAARPDDTDSAFRPPFGEGSLKNVPFYPQLAHQCGPASLAGALNCYGEVVTPEEIAATIFRENIRGAVTLNTLLYARQKGFSVRWCRGNVADIKQAVDKGAPLIVMVDLGFANIRRNHYMVAVGCGPEGLIANSGKDREKRISWNHFLKTWERAKRWTLRIEPNNPE